MNSIRITILLAMLGVPQLFAQQATFQTEMNVSASPLQSYRAFTNEWQLRRWTRAREATFLSKGGPWRLVYDDNRIEEGFILVAAPGDSLTYSIMGQDTQVVHVEFTPNPSGTHIRIMQQYEPSRYARAERDSLNAAWSLKLNRAADFLNNCPGCYIAEPYAPNPAPAVVILHDGMGINRVIRSLADSLARSGYVAIAVDMFKGETTSDPAEGEHFLSLVKDEEAYASAKHAVQYARNLPGVRADRVGVWGLGYGGTIALKLLADDQNLRSCVIWYDAHVSDPDSLKRITRPVLAIFADNDTQHPRAEIDTFTHAMVQAGVRVESVVLPGGQRFAEPAYGIEYSDRSAREAYQRSLVYLDKNLKNERAQDSR